MFQDYPAAHSVDTEWFAIDEDGYIALFGSGLEGAVPDVFANKFRDRDLGYDALFKLVIDHLPKDEKGWFYLECDHNLVKEIIRERARSLKSYLRRSGTLPLNCG